MWIGGKYECEIVTLHSTVNQIVCKTRPALDGSYDFVEHPYGMQYDLAGTWKGARVPVHSSLTKLGSTEALDVRVYVNGLVSLLAERDPVVMP